MPRTPMHCRYFANGICSKGSSCAFVHDRNMLNSNICQFNLAGVCSFGTSCRFLHTRPANSDRSQSTGSSTPSSASTTSRAPSVAPSVAGSSPRRVRPVELPKPQTFNARAVEFIPSWKKTSPASSYASAAAANIDQHPSSSSSSSNAPSYKHTQMTLCPYFQKNGECTRKDTDCIFAHGEYCDMCRSWSLHPYNEEKKREHQKECLENHHREMERAFMEQRSESKTCGICMENITEKNLRFGILNGCQHCFCLECIRQWRTRNQSATSEMSTKTVRSCPECRQHSDYVIPSMLWVESGQEKDLLIEMYKEGAKKKVCKYYNGTTNTGYCPFGNKCFYKHQLPDGSIDPGEDPHVRRAPRLSEFIFDGSADDDDDDEDEEDMLNEELLDRIVRTLLDRPQADDYFQQMLNLSRR